MNSHTHWRQSPGLLALFYSNIYIALVATAFFAAGCRFFSPEPPRALTLAFVAGSTWFIYLADRIPELARPLNPQTKHRWLARNHRFTFVGLALSIAMMAAGLTTLPWPAILLMGALGAVSLSYTLFVQYINQGDSASLRLALTKPAIVGTVWATMGVLLPVILYGEAWGNPTVWLLFGARFLLIFLLAALFDIGDQLRDAERDIPTLPVVLGIPKTRVLLSLLLMPLAIIYGLLPSLGWMALVVPALALPLVWLSSPQRPTIFYLALVDSAILAESIALWLLLAR